ncbi:N-methyl-D-aspartate receptor NMDAR2C subunit [Ideonella azotifigens]|uniref:N-methyl-D-aspartate receptor NMDAR2C subunit n=1 Tax=Ideonella azotifigens TaxID=513160 RepID=A0ABP3VPJ5_9BURK|nr:N-methyl-D-aspartate receptor NMDAR2C subunit [Ideonella azotifigens]MCD2340448.1 N-methyl-D-aspartate receptor NMDAR2C subunit [Ideonella azotifigens]
MDDGALSEDWRLAWQGLGLAQPNEALFNQLLARYREPQRHYHTLQHLGECLTALQAAQGLAERPAEVALALWFHDAIYDTRGSGNEQRSADWAGEALASAGAPAEVTARVHALIMATSHTAVPAGPDAQLLVDIDLAILGAEPARFAEYEQQIRAEYSFVPRWLFRRKRRAILASFLERQQLYSTGFFHDRLEARARLNLAQAIG